MTADDLYILPEHVQLIPVADITEPARSKFEYNDDDFVLTYTNARNTSKVIDAASAVLLRQFKEPASMAAGIFKYSYLNKLNPQETLEEAYLFLSRLRSEGFLVKYDANAKKEGGDLLQRGATFNGYEVLKKLQGIADTEVYKLQKEGTFYALKILKPEGKSPTLAAQFHNEAQVLEQLNNYTISPKGIESGSFDENLYLVMEYVEGVPCDTAVEKYRNLNSRDNLSQLLRIAGNILAAYETLHKASVIHSDIHPRNILVSQNGDVKLIDFGLSRFANAKPHSLRGGISFFYEPEYARAIADGTPLPPSSVAGEQYAVAALLYLLLTGKQYLNFSYEKDVLLQQILTEPPLPFRAHDIDVNAEIEAVLFKALSKNAADRYASMSDFKTAWLQVTERLAHDTTAIASTHSYTAFCNDVKNRFGFNGPFIETGLQVAPACSVNYGAAGIAYMFYRMALTEKEPELLALADVWANRAYDYLKRGDAAFYATDIEITPETVGAVSIYHSATGVHLVQALISAAMGDDNAFQRSVFNFITDASKPCGSVDLTVGKSSVLIGCALLFEQLADEHNELRKNLQQFGNAVMNDIWTDTNRVDYNGIAHGWAGILYATLRWCMQSSVALPELFMQRVESLRNAGIEEGDYIRWPLTADNKDSWAGWCHGSAGYTFLWCALYRFTGDERYLETAEKTAKHFLAAEAISNASLCCGLAGECYALLSLYNTTKNAFYLTETKKRAKQVLQHVYSTEGKNNSLYKGDIGAAVLLTELMQPEHARMPLFE